MVVAALLAFAREQERARAAQEGHTFSGIPEADRTIETNPNAFLFGALFTQGMPAEKAWAGPYLLGERIGHLDPVRIASTDFEELASAFARKPALHRFKRQMAHYVQSAAAKLVDEYCGDASNVWTGRPTAAELQGRLIGFEGIGQKKAAMITEVLSRHFGVPLRDLSGADVACDVHVRRVMFRTGLSPSQDVDAVVESARRVHPEHPGLLDLACWLIGRHWCHATRPDCDGCRLGAACPRVTPSLG